MPAPPFWAPAVLQRDLRQLGHAAVPASVAPSGNERVAALRHLALLVDPEHAPGPSAPAASLDRFWAALGLHSPPPDTTPAPHTASTATARTGAHATRARRHAAAAYMRAAIDLAFAARGAEYSAAPEYLPEDAPTDAVRAALIENLYSIFPRATPSYPEPKYKPKKRRPNPNPQLDPHGAQHNSTSSTSMLAIVRPEKPLREPLGVLRSFVEANAEAGDAMLARGLVSSHGDPPGGVDGPTEADASPGTDADDDTEAEVETTSRGEDAAHNDLLELGVRGIANEGDPGSRFADDDEVDALARACCDATEAAGAYRTMASEALALSMASNVVPALRDLRAEALLEKQLGPARKAQSETEATLSRVARIRTAYTSIANVSSQSDVERATLSLARYRDTANMAEEHAIRIERSLNVRPRSISERLERPQAPHLPSRET